MALIDLDAPTGELIDLDTYTPAQRPEQGGFIASAKQSMGSLVKGAGQAAADYIPGVDQDNALKRYGQSVIEANPTAVHSLEDIGNSPWMATKEAAGNAGGSIGTMLGARALGTGITALSPLTGPAAPAVALLGQAVSWFGPAAVAALPSYGGIRDKQILNDPASNDDWKSKAIATLGAATVGAIETKFGPQEWALSALTKEGRAALAEKFAETTLAKSIGFGALKGAAIEGGEELVQNPIEQLASYDDPTTRESLKDTAFGGAMGALGGGVLGGGAGAMFSGGKQTAQDTKTPESPAAPLQIGNTPDPMIGFPDGTVARRSEVDAYINSLPEDQRVAARAKLQGLEKQPAKPDDILKTESADAAISTFTESVSTPVNVAPAISEEDDLADLQRRPEVEQLNPARLEGALDGFGGNAERLSNLSQTSAFGDHGLGGLDIPSQRLVLSDVIAATHDPEIRQAVIQSIPVDVVNMLTGGQSTADELLSNESMLKNALFNAIGVNNSVPVFDAASALVGIVADATAKKIGTVSSERNSSPTDDATLRAVEGDDFAGATEAAKISAGGNDSKTSAVSLERNAAARTGKIVDTHVVTPTSDDVLGAVGGETPSAPPTVSNNSSAVKQTPAPVDARLVPKSKRNVQNAPQTPANGKETQAPAVETRAPVAGDAAGAVGVPAAGAAATVQPQGIAAPLAPEVSRYNGKYNKGMNRDAARIEAQRLNRTNDGITYAAEEHNDPKLENPYAVVGRKAVKQNKPQAPIERAPVATETVAKPRKKPAGGKTLRSKAYDKNPLLTFLATHGLFHDKTKPGSHKVEFSPDKAIMVMGYGPVFKKTGKRLDELTQNAIEEGYLPADGTESQLRDLVRRAVAGEKISPLYAEGVAEQIAEQNFAEHLAQQQEAAQDEDFDPFQSLEEIGYEIEDALSAGRSDLTVALQNEVDALLFQAEDAGIDVDQIKADAVAETEKGSQDDFLNATKQKLETAISSRAAGGDGSSAAQDGSQGRGQATITGSSEGSSESDDRQAQSGSQEGFDLSAPTRRDVIAQQDALDAEAKRKEEGGDRPIQKKVTGDTPDMFNTQGSVFDVPAEPTPADPIAQSVQALADAVKGLQTALTPKAEGMIDDVGEKIGGARKDTAVSTGAKRKTVTEEDERPTWAKRFQIAQVAGGFDASVNGRDITGKWTISDLRNKDRYDQPKRVGEYFNTKEAAEAALPLIAVAQKHRVASTGSKNADGAYTYEIWRDVNDRKRVKVVDQVFDSREEAMKYMAEHAKEILETNTTFGEADLPKPDNTGRTGVERRTGDVKGEDFRDTFGFRGVEFGLWNNQDERQEVMNAAYDGLMDLAEVLKVPPKAIGLNGDLALAFGARGKGLSGARAHYEQDRVVMNLTKMNGAGALAHEWFHALDHYLARQDGKTTAEWKINKDGTRSLDVRGGDSDMASSGFLRTNSGVREELRAAYTSLVQSLFSKAEQYVEDTARADKFVSVARGELEKDLADLRANLAEQLDVRYYKRNNKPASAEQLAEFDTMAAELVEGRGLSTEWKMMPGKTRLAVQSRHTNETLEKLNEIVKAVRGRSGFNTEHRGVLDSLSGYMKRYDQRMQMLREATALTPKTKRVPTSFAMDAKSLDQGRGGDYWTSPHEMVARAFQGFVEDAIAAKEGQSPFLNYAPENAGILTPWGAKRPYPAGAERKAMNAEFEKFIDVLETKETDKGVAMFSRTESEALQAISENADLFQYEKSDKDTVEGIAKDVNPAISVRKLSNIPGETRYILTTPDGNTHRMMVRPFNPYADKETGTLYGYHLDKNNEMTDVVMQRPGKNAEAVEGKDDVYIDVSLMEPGQYGAQIYAIAQNYAHNAGKIFIGDPAGLSDKAMKRRVENMLSSALKFGTTAHLAPHPRQVKGDLSIGVPALDWTYGDDLANIKSLVNVSNAIYGPSNPITFEPRTGQFLDSEGGVLDDDAISLIDGLRRSSKDGIGLSTTKRNAVLSALLREESKADGGDGATGRGLLDRLVEVGVQYPVSTRNIFYSRGEGPATGLTPAQFTTELTKAFGAKVAEQLQAKGVVIPLADQSQLPAHVVPFLRSGDIIYGFYDPKTDRTYAVLENLTPEMVKGLALHEVGVHYGFKAMLGDAKYANVMTRLDVMRRAGSKAVKEAYAKAQANSVRDSQVPEETLAYLVQTQPEMGIVKEIIAKIKAFLYSEFGIGGKYLTEADLTMLARAAVDHSSRVEEGGSVVPAFMRQPGAPTEPDSGGAMFSRTQNNPHSWDAPEPSQFDDLVYRLQDKQIDTKRVTQAIRELSGQLADEKDVYLQEELFHGRAAARTEDFVNKELGPLVTDMKMRGIDIATLDEYLHARHAEEANALIADREPSMPDGGSGMTNKAARDYMAKLPAAERQRLEAVAAKVDAILGKTRQMYADYHLESDATVKGWGKMFKHYVPLMREDKDGAMGIGQGFSIKGKETKGRTGSTRKVVDILANIAMQRERAIVRGEKNHVATALVGLAKSNPNPEFWYTGPPPTERVYDPKTNSVVDRADPLYKSRENVIVAKVKQPSGEVEEVAVSFNEDNERAMRMAAALKNLDAAQLNGVLGVSAKITRYFAAINTQYNPIFGTVNLVRDFQGALLNLSTTPLKNHKTEIAGHTLSALKGIYLDARAARDGKPQTSAWATLWEEFQAEGGQTGYRDMFANSGDRAKAIEHELNPTKWMDSPLGKVFTAGGALKVPLSIAQKKATGLFNWLSDYNLAMENAVRLSAYKVGLEQGMSKQQAASLAKNLTVNFNRKGQVGQQAGAIYAFFNASMQGSARIGQTLFDMDGSDMKSIRLSSTGKKIVYGGMLLGTMQALLLAAAGFDNEEPPDFVRERSLIIPTGGKSYITIPMPLGLHVLPNMGRIPTEFALGGFKQPAKHIAKLLGLTAGAFNPIGGGASLVQMLSPTAVDPMVALAENKDWTGKPIAKTSYNKATPGHALVKDTASAPSKVLSEAINLMTGGTKYTAGVFSPTPDQIDYLWGQATGGVGRELSKVQQTASASITGEDLPVHKIPLVGRFYGNADTQSAQSSKFYATINRLNEHEAEIKGLQKDGKGAELREYLAENPDARLFKMANAVELEVQKMRRMKREMLALGAPQERIKTLEDRITAKMTQFNQTVARLKTARETATAQ